MRKSPKKEPKIEKQKPWLNKEGKPKPGFTKDGKVKVSTMKNRIDRLMGQVVRSEGRCFAEGVNGWQCSQRFENCHIIRRGCPVLFCDPLNLVCMCNIHHRFYTSNEDLWKEKVEEVLPGRYDYLRKLQIEHKESGQKIDWGEWETFWKRKLREITG